MRTTPDGPEAPPYAEIDMNSTRSGTSIARKRSARKIEPPFRTEISTGVRPA